MAQRTSHPPSTFSRAVGITRTSTDDWFDPKLHQDTDLFVDPFLMFQSTDRRWSTVHDRIIEFFNHALMHVAAGHRNPRSVEWTKAGAMLSFPEPTQFCIGYGDRTIFGSGSGRRLGQDMLRAAVRAIEAGINHIDDFGELMLFGEGFGADRISDMTCNIVMDLFIDYTTEVANTHGVTVQQFTLPHAGYDIGMDRWSKRKVTLPLNPCWTPETPVILVPEAFLDALPKMEDGAFWDWVYNNENEQLRTDLGYLVTSKVKRAEIIAKAKQSPHLVRRYGIKYASRYRNSPPKPYDFDLDPLFKRKGFEGAQTFTQLARFVTPADPPSFCEFVGKLVAEFKWIVEERGLWKNFWSGSTAYSEKQAQGLFHAAVVLACRERDIDVTPEADAGSGPVDFKFSTGWKRRALVELKFAKSSSYWDNLERQTPQYMKSDDTQCGYIVVVQHTDAHCTPAFVSKTRAIVAKVALDAGIAYTPVFVDVRQRPSASKLKKTTS